MTVPLSEEEIWTGDQHTQREDNVKTQREDGHLHAKE